MPEGDTIHKIARAVAPQLTGRPLARLWLRDRGEVRSLAGARIEEVAAVGKHLLVAIGPRAVLHVHLGMHGRWRRLASDAPLRRGGAAAAAPSVRIDTESCRYACFRAAVAELLPREALRDHPVLARLGPDLLAPALDLEAVVARARRRDRATAAELLLDQTVACGLGNVYCSEVLFLERVHPAAPPRALADARLAALYARGRALLLANLGAWPRTTVRAVRGGERWPAHEPRHWVYRRGGQPCLRCGGAIASARHGAAARTVWWCPACQPAPSEAAGREAACGAEAPSRQAAADRP